MFDVMRQPAATMKRGKKRKEKDGFLVRDLVENGVSISTGTVDNPTVVCNGIITLEKRCLSRFRERSSVDIVTPYHRDKRCFFLGQRTMFNTSHQLPQEHIESVNYIPQHTIHELTDPIAVHLTLEKTGGICFIAENNHQEPTQTNLDCPD